MTLKITFENEPAIDGGRPVREYLPFSHEICYLLQQLFVYSRTKPFLPIHNTDVLHSNLFKVAGRMVAASVCHGGPGFPVFSKGICSYFQNPNPDDLSAYISTEDVVDIDVVEALQKVQQLCEVLTNQPAELSP